MPDWRGLVLPDVHPMALVRKATGCNLLRISDPIWGVLRAESVSRCHQEQLPEGELKGVNGEEENR